MNRVTTDDVPAYAARSFSGLESWMMAIMLPSAATFRSLLDDPAASRRRAYLWVVTASLLPFLLALQPTGRQDAAELGALALDIGTRVLAGIIGLALLAAPTHLLCGLLGGSAPYGRLEYAFAAWYAPLLLIAGLPLFRASGVGVLSPLAIYGALLGVTGARAVYSFGWGRALVGTLLWPAVVLLLLRQGSFLLAQ
jgi:hypothetical protein